MRLRRVVISGFKTFARRSEIIVEPGITAIVGPNGSGKSNLVDAVRWALGETNARELRGARMDEVIYSGGSGRGRMGIAEVELILDNQDGSIAVDDPEIAVSRRVTRGGESEYRLNGERARLRDVERLLGNTGLTQSGYSVVAQNDIDAIIEATPAQRRALVEQAAGVRSLRAASEDALSRVKQAEVTLRRFQDLLDDAEPRLADLAAQAALALEQRELTERLAQLRGSLAREEWRAARAQLKQARRRAEAAQSRLQLAVAADTELRQKLEAERRSLESARRQYAEMAAQLEAARLDAERAEGETRRYGDRRRSAALQRAAVAAEIELLSADLKAARRMESEAAATNAEIEAQVAKAEAEAEDRRRQYQEQLQLWQQAEADRNQLQDRLVAAEAATAKARAAGAARQTQLQLFDEASSLAESELAAVETRLGLLEAELETARDHETAAEVELQSLQAQLAAAEDKTAAAQLSLRLAEERLVETTAASREALMQQAAYEGQLQGVLGGRDGLEAAVAAGRVKAKRMLDLIAVPEAGDRAAVEAALEAYLGAWLVADPVAIRADVQLESRRTTLLGTQTAAPMQSEIEGTRRAIDAVQLLDPEAEAVVRRCLANTWIVSNNTAAEAVITAGGVAVFADGQLRSRTEMRLGGKPGETLQLAALEGEASGAATRAAAEEEEAAAAADKARLVVAGALEAEKRLGTAIGAAQSKLASCMAERAAKAAAKAAEERQLEVLRQALSRRREENAELAQQSEAVVAKLSAAEAETEQIRTAFSLAEARLDELRPQLRSAEDAARRGETEVTRNRLSAEELEQRRRLAADTTALVEGRLSAARMRLHGAESEALVAIVRGRLAEQQVSASLEQVEKWAQKTGEGQPAMTELEGRIAILEAERSEVAIALARAEDESAASGSEVEVCQVRVSELAEAVRGDLEDEGPEPDAGDAERAEREIVRLERRIAALGPVNALAPEQHGALEEQVLSLRHNSGDLASACADIRAMATSLTAEIDHRFSAVFGAVGIHFQELFNELFPGGKATLRLQEVVVEEADEGTAVEKQLPGVEILAQPPGKRLQPLSLLSGGERALTALAMILALQQVNPSPFYIFDEVDAPLDDSNVVRFTKLLKRLSANQQFIVVTHNHITMAAANALYGISIDVDGISNVLSVRFEEAELDSEIVGMRRPLRAAAS